MFAEVGVGEDLVGFADALETVVRGGVVGVLIWGMSVLGSVYSNAGMGMGGEGVGSWEGGRNLDGE